MANNYSTTIKFLGNDADVAEVMAFIEETEFDFNRIIPEPKEENKDTRDTITWRYDNWGTSCTAFGIEVDGNELYYETLNGSAIDILEHISSLYPVKIEFSTYNHTCISGYDGEIEAGEVIKCEYWSDYPLDDDIEDIENNQELSTQELMDDGLPF